MRERVSSSFSLRESESNPHPPPEMANFDDLPDAILSIIFTLVVDTRTRNAMSLVCGKWLVLERSTRTSITLRGNVRHLFDIPTCFRAVIQLDLSLLSPWGQSIFDSSPHPISLAHYLRRAFPNVISLTLYARTPSILRLLAPQWPSLRHVKLVRWHPRSANTPPGSDFLHLFHHCPSLSSLDLSHFYCWTDDLPPALQAHPLVAASLSRLNLLILSSDGFKSHQLLAITSACPNLTHLLATCVFHPRFNDFVGDKTLIAVALHCPRLSLLHLADPSSLSTARGDPDHDGFTSDDAMISRTALENLFSALPLLEELTLDICHNVMDTGPALEVLNSKCPGLKSLKLGQFHGICKAIDSQLDGIALCRLLESLSIKNTGDLTDSGLIAISRGCQRLARFEVQGCKSITETGVRTFACLLRQTLVDVSISCCKNLDATSSLRSLEPIRDRIQRLHIDCVWDSLHQSEITGDGAICQHGFEPNESREDASTSDRPAEFMIFLGDDGSKKKRCKYSGEVDYSRVQIKGINCSRFWRKTWDRLRYLSLWIAVGELLNPLASSGLDNCPVLEEIRIRVEGDCRMGPKPTEQPFGLSSLARYPRLSKMQLDCGDAIGYALTAPTGHMDLSLWERVYLMGIENLNLTELDYWPPQDRDVNQRSLSLPAAGLLAQCTRLRKLFIHGTAYEHFMMFLLGIPNLRDVQLREDYYPAPENDMSTEMRVDSCSRFEQALNRRQISD